MVELTTLAIIVNFCIPSGFRVEDMDPTNRRAFYVTAPNIEAQKNCINVLRKCINETKGGYVSEKLEQCMDKQ